MTDDTPELPVDPEQTCALGQQDVTAAIASDMPGLPTWTVVAQPDATHTVGSDVPLGLSSDNGNSSPQADPIVAYRLLRQIGQGSMGEIWEAEQSSLGRVIAVKRLRSKGNTPRAASDFMDAEFRGESAIAASLEHPNILPVYDLGCDDEGSLLLAMKRVHGKPWKEQLQAEFADSDASTFLAHHVPVLVAVTQAVAFAHSRGIIHRDLKPAQVMVGAFGEILLTDWGLAVQVDAVQGVRGPALHSYAPTPDTATNPAGTPALMAPEQTQTHGGNLGPWTDVYLLGGILYYLLTGTYPHAAESSEAAFGQARDGRVQAPSARTSSRDMPAELEQLCLRALEPKPQDRVASATDFLHGLNDYLRGTVRKQRSSELAAQAGQTLSAGNLDYAGYSAGLAALDEARRLWPDNPAISSLRQRALHDSARLALRHGDLSFASLQCAALAPGDATTTLGADIERRRRQVGRRRVLLRVATAAVFVLLLVIAGGALLFSTRMRSANQEIAQRAQQAEHALTIAKARSSGAFGLINFVLHDLKTAMDEELTPQRGINTEARNAIASGIAGKVASPIVSYFGKAQPASWPPGMQLERTKQMAAVAGRFRVLGRFKEAIALLKPALALRDTLPDPDAEDARQLINQVAVTYGALGQFNKAIPMLQRLVAIESRVSGADAPEVGELLNNLGTMNWRVGNFAEAEKLLRHAVANFEQHPEYKMHDRLPHALDALGNVLSSEGKLDEAEKLLRRSLAITRKNVGPNNIKAGSVLNDLAAVLNKKEQYAEAQKLYLRSIAINEATFGPDHPSIGALSLNMGVLLRGEHRDAEAAKWLHRALKIQLATAPQHPRTALVLRELGYLDLDHGRYKAAEPLLRQSLGIFKAAFGPAHRDVGLTGYDLGLVLKDTHQLTEAQTVMRSAYDTLRKASGEDDKDTQKAKKALAEIVAATAAPAH